MPTFDDMIADPAAFNRLPGWAQDGAEKARAALEALEASEQIGDSQTTPVPTHSGRPHAKVFGGATIAARQQRHSRKRGNR